jgi:hypothetical protein
MIVEKSLQMNRQVRAIASVLSVFAELGLAPISEEE